MPDAATSPTRTTYAELQHVFDVLNRELFDGQLPACLMTLQREKSTLGYFSFNRFVSSDGGGEFTDEIALNPTYFARIGLREIVQTVAHEMVHLWQAHYGEPGRGRYHNKEWAAKMEEIGLMPSHTGEPGGRKVGQKMSDYPIDGGRFLAVFDQLATDAFRISWYDRYIAIAGQLGGVVVAELNTPGVLVMPSGAETAPKKPTRVKYQCAGTGAAVWGKPGLSLVCGETGQPYEPVSGYAPRSPLA
ncbi:SprT-like domain-containing protein (plasmid) [Brevundimonas olei]|uniref:SprT-like domain-containing protein n=1 Tax=Brevundimonas olei TaxID=657642 RepID=A0ABZ2IG22_9CAUL